MIKITLISIGIFLIILIVTEFVYYNVKGITFFKGIAIKWKIKKILLNNTDRNGMTLIKWKKNNVDFISLIYKYPEVDNPIITLRKELVDKMFPNLITKFKEISSAQRTIQKNSKKILTK